QKLDIEKNGTEGLKDEKTFKNWIVENLSKTEYNNSEEAIADYQKLVSQSETLIKDNLTFFKEIENNQEEFLNLLDEQGMYESPTNIATLVNPYVTNDSPCTFECINNAVACN